MGSLLLMTVAILLTSVGIVMEKKALLKFKKFDFVKVILNNIWLTGFLLTVVGESAYLWALSLNDVTVVQPLMNLTIPGVVLLGAFVLKERFSLRETFGMVIMFIGALCLTMVLI